MSGLFERVINRTADAFYTRVSEITEEFSQVETLRNEIKSLKASIKYLESSRKSLEKQVSERTTLINKITSAIENPTKESKIQRIKKLLKEYYGE